MDKSKKNCGYITNKQKKELIMFMEEYPRLKSGKFNEKFSTKTAQELWMKLRDKLNALPGAKKEWKQWRKTWQDMKSKTKRKTTEIKNYRMGTGGGPAAKPNLDSDDEKILEIIGPVVVDGDPNIEESSCIFNFDESEMNLAGECSKAQGSSHVGSHVLAFEDDTPRDAPILAEAECLTETYILSSVKDSKPASKKRINLKSQKLNKTIEANEKLLGLTREHNDLYKRDVEANESKAESLRCISEHFKILIEYLINEDK